MLKKRFITAFALLSVLIPLLLYAPIEWLRFTAFLITSLGALEWVSFSPSTLLMKILNILTILACSLVAYTLPAYWFVLLIFCFWLSMGYIVFCFPRYNHLFEKHWWFNLVVGTCLLAPFGRAIVDVIFNLPTLFTENGRFEILSVLLLISVVDSGAYFSGLKWGKRRMAQQISPGKTREGLFGGMVCVLIFLLGLICAQHFNLTRNMMIVLIGMCLSLLAVLGDLFESMVKRIYQVKDSGAILPGHGGILDRIDSATAVIPVYAVVLYLMK